MTFFFTVETSDITQLFASYAENVGIEPELFQARSYSLYFVTEYIVTRPHRICLTGIMKPA